jgi:hypothetical protein
MRPEEVSQILLSPQLAHDLGDDQCGKNTLGLQTQRQEIGEHFDQPSGVQTVALEVHEADLDNRFHDLPETLNDMMLLPHVPDPFRWCPLLLNQQVIKNPLSSLPARLRVKNQRVLDLLLAIPPVLPYDRSVDTRGTRQAPLLARSQYDARTRTSNQ